MIKKIFFVGMILLMVLLVSCDVTLEPKTPPGEASDKLVGGVDIDQPDGEKALKSSKKVVPEEEEEELGQIFAEKASPPKDAGPGFTLTVKKINEFCFSG
jgi:hypothetical protein